MRHGKKFNHLGRKAQHRQALLSNLAIALITHKRITTTVAKAKALRKYVEPLVTKSKTDTTHNRRVVFSYLQNKDAVSTLFREISTQIADRPGGYLRIIKLGNRQGDNAEMAMIEFVDFNPNILKETKKSAGKKRTRRGGKAKETADATVDKKVAEKKEEAEELATEEAVEPATEEEKEDTTPSAETDADAEASNEEEDDKE